MTEPLGVKVNGDVVVGRDQFSCCDFASQDVDAMLFLADANHREATGMEVDETEDGSSDQPSESRVCEASDNRVCEPGEGRVCEPSEGREYQPSYGSVPLSCLKNRPPFS